MVGAVHPILALDQHVLLLLRLGIWLMLNAEDVTQDGMIRAEMIYAPVEYGSIR
jgi:hypothetical protein